MTYENFERLRLQKGFDNDYAFVNHKIGNKTIKEKYGIYQQTLNRWANKIYTPSFATQLKIIKALGCPREEIFK